MPSVVSTLQRPVRPAACCAATISSGIRSSDTAPTERTVMPVGLKTWIAVTAGSTSAARSSNWLAFLTMVIGSPSSTIERNGAAVASRVTPMRCRMNWDSTASCCMTSSTDSTASTVAMTALSANHVRASRGIGSHPHQI